MRHVEKYWIDQHPNRALVGALVFSGMLACWIYAAGKLVGWFPPPPRPADTASYVYAATNDWYAPIGGYQQAMVNTSTGDLFTGVITNAYNIQHFVKGELVREYHHIITRDDLLKCTKRSVPDAE